MSWHTLTGEPITHNIAEHVEQTVLNEILHGNDIRVCVGTDSQVKGHLIEYATAIVFVRKQNGGFMFIQTEQQRNTITLKERMLNEVYKSIGVAYDIYPSLQKYHLLPEVHADINTNPRHKSYSALAEAMGYIQSMGFIFKAKPEAFASSCCANKAVH